MLKISISHSNKTTSFYTTEKITDESGHARKPMNRISIYKRNFISLLRKWYCDHDEDESFPQNKVMFWRYFRIINSNGRLALNSIGSDFRRFAHEFDAAVAAAASEPNSSGSKTKLY